MSLQSPIAIRRKKPQIQESDTSFGLAAQMGYKEHEWQKILVYLQSMFDETRWRNESMDPRYRDFLRKWMMGTLRLQGMGRQGDRNRVTPRNLLGLTGLGEMAIEAVSEFGTQHDEDCFTSKTAYQTFISNGKIGRGELSVYCPHPGVTTLIHDYIDSFMKLAPKTVTSEIVGFRPVTPQIVAPQRPFGYNPSDGYPAMEPPEEQQSLPPATTLPTVGENQDNGEQK